MMLPHRPEGHEIRLPPNTRFLGLEVHADVGGGSRGGLHLRCDQAQRWNQHDEHREEHTRLLEFDTRSDDGRSGNDRGREHVRHDACVVLDLGI